MTFLKRRERGMVLVATGISIFVLIGMLGVAFDLGRIYIIKNESQAYADACALAAAKELDGTSDGITQARANVTNSTNKWGFASRAFTGTVTEFSQNGINGWQENPEGAGGFMFARVTANVPNIPMLFLVAVGTSQYAKVRASAVAGQVLTRPRGALPFSPVSNAPYTNSADTKAHAPNFGFTVGQDYSIIWPANPSLGNGNAENENGGGGNMVCGGDLSEARIGKATPPGGNAWRGYIQENSSDAIRRAIVDDEIQYSLNLDDQINLSPGEKSTERVAMYDRFHQDSDQRVGIRYVDYTGNGRRLILLAVNSGFASQDGSTPLAESLMGRIVGYGLFFMNTDDYDQGANANWCAEYVGSTILEGGNNQGAGGPGVYTVRLTQ